MISSRSLTEISFSLLLSLLSLCLCSAAPPRAVTPDFIVGEYHSNVSSMFKFDCRNYLEEEFRGNTELILHFCPNLKIFRVVLFVVMIMQWRSPGEMIMAFLTQSFFLFELQMANTGHFMVKKGNMKLIDFGRTPPFEHYQPQLFDLEVGNMINHWCRPSTRSLGLWPFLPCTFFRSLRFSYESFSASFSLLRQMLWVSLHNNWKFIVLRR